MQACVGVLGAGRGVTRSVSDWLWTLAGGFFLVMFVWVMYFGRVTPPLKGLGYTLLSGSGLFLLFFFFRIGDQPWRSVWPLLLASAVGVLVSLGLVAAGFAGERRERERAKARWLARWHDRESD
jgi:hypothetical protein